jgi:hypothetical protein
MALGLRQEPCVVEFDFTNLFSIGEIAFKCMIGGKRGGEKERRRRKGVSLVAGSGRC